MGTRAGWLGCSAYCTGLILVSLVVRYIGFSPWPGAVLTASGLVLLGAIGALVIPHYWRLGPSPALWLLAAALAGLAALNYSWRYPSPTAIDISHWLDRGEVAGAQQDVWGWVQEMPRLTRSEKGQIWLKTDLVRPVNDQKNLFDPPETVRGLLYVTVPAEEIQDVFPGQRVEIRGKLYAPALPKNPNAFNFQQYLADNHCYAGFSGKWLNLEKEGEPPWWKLWRLRVRIAKAHQAGLGTPAGPLVSAMALGRKAVNVPYDIQDAFIQAGLAHTLAASGFHVSLLLGVVLGIMSTPAVSSRVANPGLAKVYVGLATLAGYVMLTGGQPSVMRASFMGVGALVGLALERSVKPLGCLLLAVTLLLLINPTWIDDIGFRLSVMATLGLIVAVKPLTDWLDWLPPSLATVVAVPLAAYFWTIPLSLYYFNTLTTYSIVLNMLVTPLIMVISLGGMVSGLVAIISPGIGSVLAWVLWLPTHLLIWLVQWEVGLPGSSLATGHISLWQMFGLYGLYILGWQHRWFRQRRWLVGLMLLITAMGPLWYQAATLSQVTVLAAGRDAIMVLQDRRSTALINSGTENTAFYTVVPFLRQAGVNRLDHAVSSADSNQENWYTILEKASVNNFYANQDPGDWAINSRTRSVLAPGQAQIIGNQTIEWLDQEAKVLKLSLLGNQTWLQFSGLALDAQQRLVKAHSDLQSDVLWWDGAALSPALVAAVQPKIAIASSTQINSATEQLLQDQGIQVFCTERDGAILWTPTKGYTAYLDSRHQPITGLD